MKVLLLDDDVFLRDMYATKFTEAGHEVETAEDGKAALAKLSDTTFDAVLFDMVMPGMTGIEFMKEASQKGYTKSTTFIVLSNQSEETDKEEAKQVGAIGYIVKAETIPSDVVAKVESLAGSKS